MRSKNTIVLSLLVAFAVLFFTKNTTRYFQSAVENPGFHRTLEEYKQTYNDRPINFVHPESRNIVVLWQDVREYTYYLKRVPADRPWRYYEQPYDLPPRFGFLAPRLAASYCPPIHWLGRPPTYTPLYQAAVWQLEHWAAQNHYQLSPSSPHAAPLASIA